MKLGIFLAIYRDMSLEQCLEKAKALGLSVVEIPAGDNDYPGMSICKPRELLDDSSKLEQFKSTFQKHEMEISALSFHCNPIHPNPEMARYDHEKLSNTILLAEALGIDTVVTFSGCPGAGPEEKIPSWIVSVYPSELIDALKWQWDERIIPYWTKQAKFASEHGVKIAFELHPGCSVYNTDTMKRIRAACGDSLGANIDPSQLLWQGIDPIAMARELQEAVFYVHMKDTRIDDDNTRLNGLLDTTSYLEVERRSWAYRTVGYGHGRDFWCDFVSTLIMIGYNKTVSIEHEDLLMGIDEGIVKAVEFLQPILIKERMGDVVWK